MPLAIREFMPEFGHYIARLNGEVLLDHDHSLDGAKLYILDEFPGPWLEPDPATEKTRHWAALYHQVPGRPPLSTELDLPAPRCQTQRSGRHGY